MSETASMFFRCPLCSGVSRTISTRRRRSFKVTSAARVRRLVVTPQAISASERTEQGAITMPAVLKEPLEIAAPMSSTLWITSARPWTALTFRSDS